MNTDIRKNDRRWGSFITGVKKYYAGYLFIAPVILGILIFTLWPMLSSLYYSFFKTYTVVNPPKGFGLYNYEKIFLKDKWVWYALKVTFTYSIISIPLNMVLSFLLAMFLNQKIKGIKFFRVLYYLPVIIPVAASGLLWRDFLSVEYGLMNKFITSVGLSPSKFFAGESSSLPTLIFMGLWGLGGGMILWLAALKGVPEALYESSKIDGANWFVRTVKITIPMCTPVIFYNFIMGIIGSLQTFSGVFVITGGSDGKNHALLFYVMKVYYEAFGGSMRMGYASALSWVLFVIIAFLTFILFKTSKWVFYGEDA